MEEVLQQRSEATFTSYFWFIIFWIVKEGEWSNSKNGIVALPISPTLFSFV